MMKQNNKLSSQLTKKLHDLIEVTFARLIVESETSRDKGLTTQDIVRGCVAEASELCANEYEAITGALLSRMVATILNQDPKASSDYYQAVLPGIKIEVNLSVPSMDGDESKARWKKGEECTLGEVRRALLSSDSDIAGRQAARDRRFLWVQTMVLHGYGEEDSPRTMRAKTAA